MATDMKVLAVGSLNGHFKQALKKISAINKKSGPFNLVLCTGDFFGPDVTADVDALLNGQIQVPISTYILSGKHSLPKSVFDVINDRDGQICDNLIYLGKYGRTKTAEDLQIAYLSGIAPEGDQHDTAIATFNPSVNPPAPDYADADTHYTEEWVSMLQAGKSGVDILLTSEWPESVWTHSATSATDVLAQKGSAGVADVARALQPRYHFAAGVNKIVIKTEEGESLNLKPPFFEREPYKNVRGARYPTRFYGLAEFGAAKGWCYAFKITPMLKMETSQLEAQIPNVTLNPFVRDTMKRRRSIEDESKSFFWGGDDVGKKRQARERGPPPHSYTCKRCNQKGHYIYDCPTKEKKMPPEGYVCRLCDQKGHYIKDCPESGRYDDVKKEDLRRDPNQCWFCLSNPGLEKHLIIDVQTSVYVTLAKGGLVDWGGHMLIVPIGHYPSSWHMQAMQGPEADEAKASLKEIDEVRGRLTKTFGKMGSVTVGYELFAGGSGEDGKLMHMHQQIVPIPEELLDEIGPAFQREAEAEGLIAIDNYPADTTLPFCRVTYPSSSDTSINETVEKTKIFVPSPEKQDEHAQIVNEIVKTGRRPPRLMNLQFGRKVLADLINRPDRVDWKRCVQTLEEETVLAGKIQKVIKD